jgi:7,8-dihydro-6-hydroxymethylpterin dimethyltransferase
VIAEGPEPTESLCPVCLRKVPALRVATGQTVTLEGRCPEHGAWRTPIWRGPPSYDSWCGDEPPVAPPNAGAATERATAGGAARGVEVAGDGATGCPWACGLCPEHRQSTCTAVLEVTRRCNLACPVCFADASPDSHDTDPPLAELRRMLRDLFVQQGPVNVQLSGGEPTMREDLPEIISTACATGFTFVQLNTNGLRLAADPGYAKGLSHAGLASVFLQFDGLTDHTYQAIRGRPLAEQKRRAVDHCAQAGLGVVLVPTVVAGVNDHELGSLVRFAAERVPVVRGVHVQPISYFGRYPGGERPRLTMPQVLRALEEQTGGELDSGHFKPSGCEHARCSFRARYWVREGGGLGAVASPQSCCSSEPGEAARRAVAATSRQWGPLARRDQLAPPDELDRFLDAAGRILSVSGMLFQDAWSIDLERVRQCCVHAVVPDRGLVPFCLWNLTSRSGRRLYPRC